MQQKSSFKWCGTWGGSVVKFLPQIQVYEPISLRKVSMALQIKVKYHPLNFCLFIFSLGN